jgi:inorganic pyrophosphatase
MMIATSANFRTAYAAKKNINFAFRTAYRAGVAMGFALVSIGFLVLVAIIALYKDMMGIDNKELSGSTYEPLFEAVAGYGLGGSFVALFGRVGGGIYTKAADVGADLVGKIESNLPEDSPKNPATIADNVGDNVGDVAGMSADLFGSFAESTCAALVLSSNSILGDAPSCLYSISNFMFPISIITFGLLACIVVSSISTDLKEVNTLDEV